MVVDAHLVLVNVLELKPQRRLLFVGRETGYFQ